MPKIKKRTDENSKGINMTFDIPMLNALVKYTRCEYVSLAQISNLYKLLNQLDFANYNYSPDIKDRLELIKIITEAQTSGNVKDKDVLEMFISERKPELKPIMYELGLEQNRISSSECQHISVAINERLQYIYLYSVHDDLIETLGAVDKVGFTSYYDIINDLKGKLGKLMVKLQCAASPDALLTQFNFTDDTYIENLTKIVMRAKKPSNVLMTGMRQLNAILSPGFQSGRLYCFLGGTGKFKSGTLWNVTDQIRQYNPQIIPYENGMRKTVLFVTMENTINETIMRLFDMYNDTGTPLEELEPEDVMRILREQGNFIFTDNKGIDIEMRYYADLAVATSHMYTLIQELADCGKQVIALVVDYILKIDSTRDNNNDERLRIGYAARELKILAQHYDIPVITAMQINREGNAILDAAMRDGKEDIGRFIGSSFVGNCFNLIQECDWVAFINLEMQKSTGKWYLSFKRTKIRGKIDPLAVDYFNHPFVNNNGIRLEPDVDKEKPVSVIALASDLVSIDDKLDNASQIRPKINSFANSGDNKKSGSVLNHIDLSNLLKSA